MLVLSACLACAVVLDATPATTLASAFNVPMEVPAVVVDTLPFGNHFGLPFTREEYKRALRQKMPEAEAEFQSRAIYEPDAKTIGIAIGDANLLLLAALSDDVAQRVIAYRPQLRDLVLWIRENPEAFLAGFQWGLPSP